MIERTAIGEARDSLLRRFPFGLCLVAEETGSDFERTLGIARQLGIPNLEFGTLWSRRIDDVPLGSLVKAKGLLCSSEIGVRMIATQAFKTVSLGAVDVSDLPADPNYRDHLELLRSSIEAARFFGAPLVRIFSFRREGMRDAGNPSPRIPGGGEIPGDIIRKIAAALKPAVALAESANVRLALENVRSCWGNTGSNTSRIIDAVGSPMLGSIWDPANAYVSGEEDVVTGYRAVRRSVFHVHLKDAAVADPASGLTRWERIGDGCVDLRGTIRALRADGYDGCLSIETHWHPPDSDREENTTRTFDGLIDLLEEIADGKE